MEGKLGPSGTLTLATSQALPMEMRLRDMAKHGLPRPGVSWEVFKYRCRNFRHFMRGYWKIVLSRITSSPIVYGQLRLVKFDGRGGIVDYGIVSLRVVTTAGVNYIVDAFQNLVEPENMKFHGFGTGVAAEATGDTALGTELTTQYNPDSTRPTGTTTEGASANIYRTVATLTPDSGGTLAITEHGVFSASSAGTLLDRSVFSAVNLVTANGDSLQATYDLTFTAGS